MNKFDLNTFSNEKNYVLEASAGTGKTYNIVEIVNQLVKEYHTPLEKILIVTFTEKAAGELKDRIRGKLPDENVDGAHIGTIHSFCQDTISEFAISANLPFGLNTVDDTALESFADQYIRKEEILADISNVLVEGGKVNIESLSKRIAIGVKKYYMNSSWQEDPSIITFIDDADSSDAFALYNLIKQKQITDIQSACAKIENVKRYYHALADSSNKKENEVADKIAAGVLKGFKFTKPTKQMASFSAEGKEAVEYFLTFRKYFEIKEDGSDGKCNSEEMIASKYLKQFYIAWQNEKNKNKEQDFDDMIRNVREALLHGDKLKEKLKQKYSYAIIDEFQDTNQRQFDIFKSVFMEDDDHHIIVVGDPKQSIYSFQGADIGVYYDAVEAIVNKGGEKCELVKNYRSSASMVNSCNKLFEIYDFDGTTFIGSEHLDCSIDDKEPVAYYDGQLTKAFWVAQNEFPDDTGSIGLTAEGFAKIAVQQIVDCCSYKDGKTKLQVQANRNDESTLRNVTFKDFAVLARTKSEMIEIQAELKKAGIPFIRYKDTSVFSGRECAHWIALLEAIQTDDFTGNNRNYFKKALFTKFFDLSLNEINNDLYIRDDIPEMEKMNRWKKIAMEERWEDLIDDILIHSDLSEKMKSLKEIQSYAIFRQIGDYAIGYLSAGHSISDLIRKLRRLAEGDSDEEDAGGIVEKSTDFDSVQIMTIHASKGLEYPVIIASCGTKQPVSSSGIYSYRVEQDGKSHQVLSFNKDPRVNDEQLAEWKRLFYVAYTRAKYILLLPRYEKTGLPFIGDTLNQLVETYSGEMRIIYDNGDNSQETRTKTEEILKHNEVVETGSTKEAHDASLKQMIKEGYSKGSYMHSYSSLSHGHEDKFEESETITESGAVVESDEILEGLMKYDRKGVYGKCVFDSSKQGVELPADFPKGAAIGTALHEIFELIDYTNYSENLEKVIYRCFSNQYIPLKEEWVEPVKQMVENILTADLPVIEGADVLDSTIKLNSITSENKKTEGEFIFNKEEERLKNYFNGFIDLMFKRGEYYSIVDWKSDSLNEEFTSYSDFDQLKKHVDARYSIQRTLYAYCLIQWLKECLNESEEEIFNHHFGGVYYVFMRGCAADCGNGIFAKTWSSYKELETAFKEIVKDKIG